jgi:hypothetical protein
MTDPERDDRWAGVSRAAPWIGGAVLVVGAVITGLRVGVPAAVLWFGFAALAGAVLLFWEALRSVVDPEATADEADRAAVAGEMADLEARKRGAVKALKDLEFEHSIGRMSDEDYNALREKYRGEARAAMEAIDRGLGAYLDEAKKLVADALTAVESGRTAAREAEPASEPESPGSTAESLDETATTEAIDSDEAKRDERAAAAATDGASTAAARTCPSCGTRNDADATFCKRCAARLEEVPS